MKGITQTFGTRNPSQSKCINENDAYIFFLQEICNNMGGYISEVETSEENAFLWNKSIEIGETTYQFCLFLVIK